MTELFAPPVEQWRPISAQWMKLRILTTVTVVPLTFTIPAVLIGVLSDWWTLSIGLWAFAAVWVVLRSLLINRTFRSWGYALRADDLYITHGVLFRTLTAIPYGRMQAVEVHSGPLERAFGIASVQLITASPQSNATIIGLPPDEATALRDRLTSLGESQASGL